MLITINTSTASYKAHIRTALTYRSAILHSATNPSPPLPSPPLPAPLFSSPFSSTLLRPYLRVLQCVVDLMSACISMLSKLCRIPYPHYMLHHNSAYICYARTLPICYARSLLIWYATTLPIYYATTLRPTSYHVSWFCWVRFKCDIIVEILTCSRPLSSTWPQRK